jgi:hypothetical protein
MSTNEPKRLPSRVSLLLMTEVALAVLTLLVAPFEALTGQWHLTGLILFLVASTLVLSMCQWRLAPAAQAGRSA